MSISLDPDQARHFVGPDLSLNCLQRLSADGNNRQRAKGLDFGPYQWTALIDKELGLDFSPYLHLNPFRVYPSSARSIKER